jgi:hypothetical protein
MIPEDAESRDCFVKGYVVREWCEIPSNFRARGNLNDYLKEHDIVGVYGVDTRETGAHDPRARCHERENYGELTPDIQSEIGRYGDHRRRSGREPHRIHHAPGPRQGTPQGDPGRLRDEE